MDLGGWAVPEHALALLGLGWYCLVVLVIGIGTCQLLRHLLRPTPKPCSSHLPLAQVPHVTVIRPVDGLEPLQLECLASTFQQNYPAARLTVYFCVASTSDPAYSLLKKLVADNPAYDARVLVEADDPNLHGPKGDPRRLGPNPKIRNISAAYRAAKGDILWLIDSNVWVSVSACGLMVDQLCGFTPAGSPQGRKYKFVHQLPLAVDVSGRVPFGKGAKQGSAGAALDELFLATAHAKFYTAISTVAIAPCIVGKSNMFRRSHLDALTPPQKRGRSAGIDFFSDNICEDHLIGDLLWKQRIPAEVQRRAALEGHDPSAKDTNPPATKRSWGNHAIVLNPPCVQPLANIPLAPYIARRARWLRVRKFTVPTATAVEPGTEGPLATACLATAATNVPFLRSMLGRLGAPAALQLGSDSWTAWASVFAMGMLAWAAWDMGIWMILRGWDGEGRSVDEDGRGMRSREGSSRWPDDTSRRMHALVRPFGGKAGSRRSVLWWAWAWAGREALALPVWTWAVLGGSRVQWRGRWFRVGMDAKVRALDVKKTL